MDRRQFIAGAGAALATTQAGLGGEMLARSRHKKRCRPKACFEGGAKGLVISRKYSDMKLSNLSAVGDALRETKIV